MKLLKNKQVLALFSLLVILFGVFLIQSFGRKPTQTTTKAAKSAVLAFSTPPSVGIGQNFSLDVLLTPGTNKISAVKMVISYNPQVVQRGEPGIVPNSNVFPQVFEGPTYDQCFSTTCTMSISLAVGSDVLKVVQGQSPLPIATVNFKALQATDTNGTPIGFGNGTIVLSIAPEDEPSENVANFVPAGVVIGTTPGNASSSATMTGSLSLHFEGIDVNNNNVPKHTQRQAELDFYQGNSFTNSPDFKIPFLSTHVNNDQNGTFINNSIDLSQIPPNNYFILLKSPEGSLREALNNSQPIALAKGQNSLNGTPTDPNAPAAVQAQILRMGDLNNDNTVDINDYNILIDCYGKKQTNGSCTSHKASDSTKGLFADLNDDGIVSGIDYNILIRHFGEQGY